MKEFEVLCKRIEDLRDEMIDWQIKLTAVPALSPINGGEGEAEKAELIKKLLNEVGITEIQEVRAPDLDVPSGIIVHPGAGVKEDTLVNALLFHFPEIKGIGSEKRPGIVHRLDKDTSGLMVIAKTNRAYLELQRQFKVREVEKKYLTLVKGKMPSMEGKIEIPIGRHIRERKKISIRTTKPKEAITYYKVIEEIKDFSYLEVKPITGRTHQIRVHLSSSGHPVVGDKKYGGCNLEIKCPRLFLHAYYLSFIHPTLDKKIEFSLPLPDDLNDYLEKLRYVHKN
ncbi:RluA family pseudouridine synthase [SCandidatus Aminicenantes bacterium Aminicenantia_JdfR_composite]|nr:RluA family pseudouridine synthase [SCandidatus Aminicenantes bacterium Aminicenantia_JdfR_composite]